jgi:hypothetical protein
MEQEYLSEKAKAVLNAAGDNYARLTASEGLSSREIATGLCRFVSAFITSAMKTKEERQMLLESMCLEILTQVMEGKS